MDTNPQIIEIGEVRCSFGFEDGFFEKEFGAVLSEYRGWGFCTRGEPEITIKIKNGSVRVLAGSDEGIFYLAEDHDSVYATLFFDTKNFEGTIGFSPIREDRLAPVRMIELIETFICNAYLFYFLLNDLGIFIHASGISVGENGYIFAGSSGAGKSTVAKLSSPRKILCDELVLLRKKGNGRRRVFGTPFLGDTTCLNESAVCQGLYFLEQADHNEVLPMSKIAAAAALIKEGAIGGFMSIPEVQRVYPYSFFLPFVIDLLQDVPCYTLKFMKDDSFWEVVQHGREWKA